MNLLGRKNALSCGLAIFLLACFFSPMGLGAEIRASVELDINNSVLVDPDIENIENTTAQYILNGTGTVSINSTGNRNVRAGMNLIARFNSLDPENPSIELDRAFLITRFDFLRLMLGKNRASWGEGAVFNVADFITGASDLNIDIASNELRSNSVWLGAARFSLDRFAFIEAAVLPPLPGIQDNLSFGARILGDIPEIALKIEGGYFYRDALGEHNAYLSFHGGEVLNWHLSSSFGFTNDSFEENDPIEIVRGLKASGGLFFIGDISNAETLVNLDSSIEAEPVNLSLSLRAELLFNAGGSFMDSNPIHSPPSPDMPDPLDIPPTNPVHMPENYGIYGYLGVGLGIDRIANIFLRSIISPIDLSAVITLGADFNIYQGFSLYTNASFQLGNVNDTFFFERLGGFGANFGMRFIF